MLGAAVLILLIALVAVTGLMLWQWKKASAREQLWFESLQAFVERDYPTADAVAARLQEQAETASKPREAAFALRRIIQRVEVLESSLREEYQARRELEDVLAALKDAVLVVDEEARLRFLNAAAGHFFSVKVKDVLGAQVLEALPSLDLDATIRAALCDGQDSTREVRLYAPRPREVLLRVAPVRRNDGQVSGAVAILQDLTQLRHLEQIRRDFVANASHELRTPIANIRATAETLLSAANDPVLTARFLPKVLTEAERMSRLISDLLDLARIESDVHTAATAVDVVTLVNNVVHGLNDKALQHQIEVQCDFGKVVNGGITVAGDVAGLEQVVFNLLDNALLYTLPGGHVKLQVETRAATLETTVSEQDQLRQERTADKPISLQHGEAQDAPHPHQSSPEKQRNYVTISCTDTGIGIPQDDLTRIFERFYRVDKARSRIQGGTGLGLAIVKHIVEDHGGYVEVQSEVGQGTTFRVTLPAA